eukprot:5785498-Alexandrium_andersonii.AAC.1
MAVMGRQVRQPPGLAQTACPPTVKAMPRSRSMWGYGAGPALHEPALAWASRSPCSDRSTRPPIAAEETASRTI